MENDNIDSESYSGNAEDVMDCLDKGMLDFGILIQPGESKPRHGNAVIPRFHLLSYPLRSKSDWKHSDEDTENGVALNSMTCSKIILQLSISSNLSSEFDTHMGSRCYVFKILVTLLFEGFCVTSCFLRSKSDCLSRKMGDEVTENGFALNS